MHPTEEYLSPLMVAIAAHERNETCPTLSAISGEVAWAGELPKYVRLPRSRAGEGPGLRRRSRRGTGQSTWRLLRSAPCPGVVTQAPRSMCPWQARPPLRLCSTTSSGLSRRRLPCAFGARRIERAKRESALPRRQATVRRGAHHGSDGHRVDSGDQAGRRCPAATPAREQVAPPGLEALKLSIHIHAGEAGFEQLAWSTRASK